MTILMPQAPQKINLFKRHRVHKHQIERSRILFIFLSPYFRNTLKALISDLTPSTRRLKSTVTNIYERLTKSLAILSLTFFLSN